MLTGATNTAAAAGGSSGWAAGIPIAGGILNGISQGFTNRANRKWQHKMYNIQRADALKDWNMQNEYNSPAAQMARLKAAGLNPNLVYGNGASTVASQSPRSSNFGSSGAQAPRLDISGMYPMLMFQLREEMQSQQIENLKVQRDFLQSQIGRNQIGMEGMSLDNQKKRFDLDLANTTRDLDIALKQGNLDNLRGRTQVMLDSNERAAAMSTTNLQLAAIRVKQAQYDYETSPQRRELLRAQIEALSSSSALRRQTEELQAKGFTWSDPYYYRVGMKVLGGLLGSRDIPGELPQTGNPVPDVSPRVAPDRSLNDMWNDR